MTAGTRSLDYARQFGAGHIAVLHEFIQTKLLFILVVVALTQADRRPRVRVMSETVAIDI